MEYLLAAGLLLLLLSRFVRDPWMRRRMGTCAVVALTVACCWAVCWAAHDTGPLWLSFDPTLGGR